MSKSIGYKVLYSNDKEHWYGYGADAVKPPLIFKGVKEAKRATIGLIGTGLPRYLQIVKAENNEPVTEVSDTVKSDSLEIWAGE